MSKLKFDGQSHQLSLISKNGSIFGTWAAYNNVDSHATLKHLHNGIYIIQDNIAPHQHTAATANGPYGLYGIIRFSVLGHPGIGVHSGRANALRLPGPEHPTMGCIRTTDAAMSVIRDCMKADCLLTIEIQSNNAISAYHATLRNQHTNLDVQQHG